MNRKKLFIKFPIFFLPLVSLFVSCGGDETEIVPEAPVDDSSEQSVDPVEAPPVVKEIEEEKPEPEVLPNPNGVYLPTAEEKNGKPVYANGDGFFMWFNG